MTDAASAAFSDAVAKNKNVARLGNLHTVRLLIKPASFCARRFPIGVEIANHERPDEVTAPETEHRAEDISATGNWRFARILVLLGLNAPRLSPTSLSHKILCFSTWHPRL